ncbi:hypothetical protein OJAV_G00234560 [Oryzias javanicus]|uniref:CD99 antigen-like protein 2 n=1 Tax=Oryzias javanicus TaxID=123683 RepID=A0A3S2P9D5_ORYJA|nr:hypothetical protein OJAV_G00234560 [Oryzias javanicus]
MFLSFRADAHSQPKVPSKAPEKTGSDDGFNLADALLPDPKTTKKPSVPSGGGGGGGGGSFNDDDLLNTLDDGYKPDKTGSGGRAADPNYDSAGGLILLKIQTLGWPSS